MPLSSTRSSTSMRELPLRERSTAISAYSAGKRVLLLSTGSTLRLRGQSLEPALDALQASLNVARKKRARRNRSESRVMSPPVQSDLLRLVDRAHEQPHLNREQLDVGGIDLDVASNHQPFVQHAVENFDQYMTTRWGNEIRQAGQLRRRAAR